MTLEERNSCYYVRCMLSCDPTKPTYKKRLKNASEFELKLLETLPELLNKHCIALAEAIAVEQCGGSKNRFER